ncbi:hypothetical protein SNE40_013833 [Patella caerulea]|uniref:Homeobox domain-containing protein n=1 Tax=Patella caerulea TaxID=87958 RepID=A0AAN8PHV0_PATCE
MKTRTVPSFRSNDYLDMKAEGVKKKRNRIHYTADQTRAFEGMFARNQFPDRETLEAICEELDVSHKNAQVWFQNRRARSRRDPNDVNSPRKLPQLDSDNSNSPCSSPKPRSRPAPRPEFIPEQLVTFVKKPIPNSKWHEPIKSNVTSYNNGPFGSPEAVPQNYQPNCPQPYFHPYDYQPINHDVPFYYQPIKTHETSQANGLDCPISAILSQTNNVTQNGYYGDFAYGRSYYGSPTENGYYGNSECVTSQVRVIADANKTLTVL